MDSRSCYVSSFYSLNGCFQQLMVTSHVNQDILVLTIQSWTLTNKATENSLQSNFDIIVLCLIFGNLLNIFNSLKAYVRTWKEWREISGGAREIKKPKWLRLVGGKCAKQNQMEEWASATYKPLI